MHAGRIKGVCEKNSHQRHRLIRHRAIDRLGFGTLDENDL
jgi:hypothetical protein